METARGPSVAAHGERLHTPYCLACYAPMERGPGASHHCPRCGFANVKLDQDLFWTKEPRLVELESYAKVVVVFVVLALTAFLFWAMGQRASYGLGQGWAIGFPLFLGVILWETASAITRKKSDLRLALVWRIVCAVLAPWPLMLATDLRPGTVLKDGLRVSPWAPGLLAVAGLGLAAAALGLGLFARLLRAWRERHVLAAQQATAPR